MIWKTSKNTIQFFTTLIKIIDFFIKLFDNQNKVFHDKKCLRCSEFLPSSRFKVNHDFLAYYDAGKNAFEGKPLNYTNLGEIRKYEITFPHHWHDYDFYNAEKLVDDFLLNVNNRVGRSGNDFFIKCGFSLENKESPLLKANNLLKILDIGLQGAMKLNR